jgi:multimeric flavodoxin WrbA
VKILGLIGSSRSLGNTEILVTEIAKSATYAPVDTSVRLIRLTDLKLGYCTGCMGCALNDEATCPLDDDMEFLLSEYQSADAIILGAPAYTLLPPGPLKLIADRLILYLAKYDWAPLKPAVTVGVAGLPRWSELLLPLLNCTVLSQGSYLVDSFMAYGAGPGEVLLNDSNVLRAQMAGERLGKALSGTVVPRDVAPGTCPVCGADFFRIAATHVECPLCLARGTLENGVVKFDPNPKNRWQPEALKQHFTDWIQNTGETYLEQRPQIRPLLRPYRSRPFPMIAPR